MGRLGTAHPVALQSPLVYIQYMARPKKMLQPAPNGGQRYFAEKANALRKGSSIVNPVWRASMDTDADADGPDPATIPKHDYKSPGRQPAIANPAVMSLIVDTLAAGNYVSTACRIAGVSYDAMTRWVKWGMEGKDLLYYDFWLACQKAESSAEINRLAQVSDHAKDDWRAGMEILSRRWPERWGKKDTLRTQVDITGEIKVRNEFAELILNDASARELARGLISRTSGILLTGGSGDPSDGE